MTMTRTAVRILRNTEPASEPAAFGPSEHRSRPYAAVADSLTWAILKVSNALNFGGVYLAVRSARGMNHARPPGW